MTGKTPTERSKARYARAAGTISPVTLDKDINSWLHRLMRQRGLSAAELVRTLIREEMQRVKAGASSAATQNTTRAKR